ncbi:zinc finger, CCHC-type containing protein [Tanacetum coccineum]
MAIDSLATHPTMEDFDLSDSFRSTSKLNDSILWHARLGQVHFKRMQDMSKDGLIPAFDMDTKKYKTCMLTKITKKPFQNKKRETKVLELIYSDLYDFHATPSLENKKYFVTFIVMLLVVRLPDPKLKTLEERDIKCIFIGYVEHSKAFRLYVIEPNESVLINSIIESRDAIFDENRFSSVSRPSQRYLINGSEDIVVQWSQKWSLKRDEVSDEHSYFFNVEDDPKTFDEEMKSQDVVNLLVANGSSKKTKVARIITIRLLIALASIHDLIIHQMDVKIAFLNGELDEQVDLTKEFLSSRFSIKDIGKADIILNIRVKHEMSTLMDTREKLMPNNGYVVSQLEYSRVIGYLMYVMTCTRPYIAFVVGKLNRYTSNPGYSNACWISNIEDNSSTSGWFVALVAAGKEVERLRNLILEFPLCSKPIAPISISCDSTATLDAQLPPEETWELSSMWKDERHVHFKRMQDIFKDGLISYFDMDTEKSCYVYLLHTKDEALDKFKVFKAEVELQQESLIKRFKTRLRTDMGVVPQKVTEEVVVVQQPELELRKSKRNMTLKNFAPKFQLYLIDGTRDEVSDEHSYCFNVEDDPKTIDEAVKSQDVDLRKEFWSSRFSMKDMGEANVILVSTPMDTSEKMMPNNGQSISQLEYSRVIGCLMYAMTCIRPDIAFAVGKLSSGCVFLLGGGVISWASKKQTCITSSIMDSEFVALAAAD